MNATKRKFNALIQGIGNKPSTPEKTPSVSRSDDTPLNPRSTPTPSSGPRKMDPDSLKRRRLGIHNSAPPPATGPTSISNVVLRKWSGTPKGDGPQLQPKYCPSDRKELIRRLATFQELVDWAPKPERVSEIEWAKRGWVCKGKERVRCALCNKELVLKLNKKEVEGKEVSVLVPSEIEEALVNKYAELIIESHQEDCLWRKRGCDDSLLRISFSNATATLEALRARYDELCARKPFLPYEFNLRLPSDLDIDTILAQLPDTFFTTPPPPKESPDPSSPNRTALALALTGWQGLSDSRIGQVPNSASCHTCLRRLGLWMFKSKEVGEGGEVLVPAPMEYLDPTKEHRFFCPWKSAHTQRLGSARPNPGSDLPAWGLLVQSLKNEAYLRGVLDGTPRSRRGVSVRDGQGAGAGAPPSTPSRNPAAAPQTPGGASTVAGSELESPLTAAEQGGEEDEATRDAKDKERWARLRRVKSLFDTKGTRRLRRATLSRPGTAVSTKSASNKEASNNTPA